MTLRFVAILLTCSCFGFLCDAEKAKPSPAPIPVKVVVVTMFEVGKDTGDTPGEYQTWAERDHLDRIFPFPAGYRDLRMNDQGVLGVLTGEGNLRSTATIMALGLDPRFDFSKAYWIVAGIAGVDPADASLGSAAWAEWVVDGDYGYEIDAREIPPEWTTGYVPLEKSVPYEQPRTAENGIVYHLNPQLVDWAYRLTKNVPLEDTPQMAAQRARYDGANAQRPPFVLKGDTLSASTFWHGDKMDAWANKWVQYQTGGQGNYVTTAMEDTGTLQSLTRLARAGRVDIHRVLVLRTASNYDEQRRGITAAESLKEMHLEGSSAYLPSIENAYRIGNTVVSEIVRNWAHYRDNTPQ